MRYRRSIGVMRQDDWQQLVEMLNEYLNYVQEDDNSSNDKINDVKLLIHKLQHHIDRPAQQSYSFNRWS
ncbi:hypothetical protein [Acinetobacter baumannii]|uniref:hypothetical protein n=1 Tax=Acinetobacter baumannii TaxID=470 RepID=UPI0008107091|nr:hypothetical protein [Acinetobacter baumannii]MCW8693001.1 hypothetical protein [Acinetobacter baumannii]MCW8769878.1 hypothetical protein [Acinetobacter baumannii]MDC5599389.1 hypothetical protein [Acinetobacter baumannii]SSU95307.1 Uncharacterised protein [Acinetobacter baumannii]SSU95368.1 Uncharacterised protein [Acinetobacter baumannii]